MVHKNAKVILPGAAVVVVVDTGEGVVVVAKIIYL